MFSLSFVSLKIEKKHTMSRLMIHFHARFFKRDLLGAYEQWILITLSEHDVLTGRPLKTFNASRSRTTWIHQSLYSRYGVPCTTRIICPMSASRYRFTISDVRIEFRKTTTRGYLLLKISPELCHSHKDIYSNAKKKIPRLISPWFFRQFLTNSRPTKSIFKYLSYFSLST